MALFSNWWCPNAAFQEEAGTQESSNAAFKVWEIIIDYSAVIHRCWLGSRMCVEGYGKVTLKSLFTPRIDKMPEQVLLAMCALLFLEPERLSHVFSYLKLWATTFSSD